MYSYIAGYTDKQDRCWELKLNASSYKEGLKEARHQQKEMGKLWSFHREK